MADSYCCHVIRLACQQEPCSGAGGVGTALPLQIEPLACSGEQSSRLLSQQLVDRCSGVPLATSHTSQGHCHYMHRYPHPLCFWGDDSTASELHPIESLVLESTYMYIVLQDSCGWDLGIIVSGTCKMQCKRNSGDPIKESKTLFSFQSMSRG